MAAENLNNPTVSCLETRLSFSRILDSHESDSRQEFFNDQEEDKAAQRYLRLSQAQFLHSTNSQNLLRSIRFHNGSVDLKILPDIHKSYSFTWYRKAPT